ncbi:MAG: heme o synthase [Flavobacteriales bacterium]|nr:heme o synthase [Flavobacteriales bacterium]
MRDLALLFKLRVTSMVVISAVLGYGMGVAPGEFSLLNALLLGLGGLLVTGSSTALNEVIEVEQDSRMERTSQRPLVRGTMSITEALIISLVAGATGTALLWLLFGQLAGLLGLLSLFIYVAIYTPLKRFTPWAVLVGAIPGALPPMIGHVAAVGSFTLGAGLVFAVQFMWQFAHFWSVSWLLHDDYAKADYHLLPSRGGRDSFSGFLIAAYTFFLLLTGLLPWVFGLTGHWSALVAVVLGLYMLYHALRLMRSLDKADARRLLFAGFLYLPVVLLTYALDKP